MGNAIKAMVILAMFGVASANAAQITDTANIPSTLAGQGGTVSLDKFDPTLGTLNWVKLELDITAIGAQQRVDNESDQSSDVTLEFETEVEAQDEFNDLSAITVLPTQTVNGIVDADDEVGAADFAGDDVLTLLSQIGQDDDNEFIFSGFANFVGAGDTFDVTYTSDSTFSTSSSPAVTLASDVSSFAQDGTYSGTVVVTYDYNANPEIPAPAALPAGLALLGLIGLRRRSN